MAKCQTLKAPLTGDKVNGIQAFQLNAPISLLTCIMRFDITNLAIYSGYSYDIVGATKM